jgi:hypothetical protein
LRHLPSKISGFLCDFCDFAAQDSLCGDIEDEFRLRDGYIMKRDETGPWLIFVQEAPLIRQWWESLVSGG